MTEIAKAYVQIVPSMQGFGDQVKSAVTGASDEAGKKGGNAFTNAFQGALGGLATVAKAGAAAVGTAVVAVAGLTKSAVSQFGEYEQLVGGAQKIFDQMDYSQIAKDAQDAYKTMNLSASEYLAMMNSVGATFSQTMGDEKGYNTAKIGMQAIADYASGTGRSVTELNEKFSMITRAASSYQSIADQFSGILPATSADFLKQAQAAGFLSQKYTDLTKVPVAEYQEAVSKMLEKGVADLGLTNNTVMESEKTLTGSIAAMKASWKNLITGLSDPDADLGELIKTFVGTGKTALQNIAPAVRQTLTGISQVVKEAVPIIAAELPQLITDILPSVLSAAGTLVAAVIENLPAIMEGIGKAIPEIMNQIFTSIESILPSSLIPAFEKLKETINGVIEWLSNLDESQVNTIIGMAEVVAAIVGVIAVIGSVINVIGAASAAIGFIASPVGLAVAAIAGLVAAGITVAKHWDDIKAKFSAGIAELKQDWQNMKDSWNSVVQAISQKIQQFGEKVKSGFETAKNAVKTAMDSIKSTITNIASSAASWGRDMMDNFINGIKAKFAALRDAVSNAAQTVKNFLGFSEPKEGPLSNFHTYAPDMMKLFADGIYQNLGVVEKAMNGLAGIAASEIETGYSLGTAGRSAPYGQRSAAVASSLAQYSTNVSVRFEGSLAQLAMILKPVVDVETVRVGEGFVPA